MDDQQALEVTTPEDWDAVECRPSSGAGTLARLGRVVCLVGSTDAATVEPVLTQAAIVAANGGQGRQLVRGFALMLGTMAGDPPSFVAMAPHTTGLALLVQGDASVTVNGETISGADSLAWVEKLVPWPVTVLSASVDPAAQARPHLRLGEGVVEAGGLVMSPTTEDEPSGVWPLVSEAVPAAPPAAAPAPPASEPAPEPVAEPAPEPVAEPAPEPVAEVAPPAPPAPPAEPSPDVAALVAPLPPEPGQPAPPPPPPVQEAPPTPHEPMPVPPVDRPSPAPPADQVGGFDSVLLSELDPDDIAPLPLAEMPQEEGHEHVRGVYCKNRHFNDPRVLFCAVCGINMVQQTPVLVDGVRPPLGVIVLDDGAVYQVDKDYLLGRDPESDQRVREGEVRGVVVQDVSNQISRVHARLDLRGWDVVLVDNRSTNGTFVNPPDVNAWSRLAPGGEHVLVQGTRVRLGNRTLAFNTHAGG